MKLSVPKGESPVSAGVPVIQRGRLCPEAKQVAPRVAEALAEAQGRQL